MDGVTDYECGMWTLGKADENCFVFVKNQRKWQLRLKTDPTYIALIGWPYNEEIKSSGAKFTSAKGHIGAKILRKGIYFIN